MNKRRVIFIGVLLLSILVGSVSAAVLIPANHRYEAMLGSTIVVTNSIAISEEGHGLVVMPGSSSGIGMSPTDPVYFNASATKFAATPRADGDWAIDVRLNTTASTPPNSVFEVKFRAPGGFSYATLYVATGPTVTPNAMVGCLFDVGPTITMAYTYTVTVRKL